MANRTKVIETLRTYFQTKGRVLSAQEYSRETDTPIRIQQLRNIFGSWKKVENLLMASDRITADQVTDVDAVINARNAALNEAAKQWREASENQDVKARREAEALAVAEVLAANAATPEGANANKIAIGGKLRQEQQDFTALGATVTVDPVTHEQTVVDTKPEVLTTTNEDPRTPLELRDAVAADKVKAGSADAGEVTSGSGTGTASVATASALSNNTNDEEIVADKSTTNTTSTETKKVPADEAKKK